jgi:predicted alpha/beta-hydrolase family hydrolase
MVRRHLNLHIAAILILSWVTLTGYGCDYSNVCTSSTTVSYTSDAKLYYPCNISTALPATTMTSGYMGTLSQVDWLSKAVANDGFVVLAFTPSNIYGYVSGWRDAHKAAISKLKSINTSTGTLKGKINTAKLQTCGHSKGGGGSLWASSQLGTGLAATIGMAPWKEQFTNTTLAAIKAPTLIQAGTLDSLATRSMTYGEYYALSTSIKRAYFEYSGTDHMSWASGGSNQTQLGTDVVAWMRYYLKGDTAAASQLAIGSGKVTNLWVK